MNVKVCDALCGSGKTSAAIKMMNKRSDRRYIFVTQFLSEVARITRSCPEADFVSPSYEEQTKLESLNILLRSKRNIATTHSLFLGCNDETKELIREGGYVLVLDEVVEVFNMAGVCKKDVELLKKGDLIEEQDGCFIWKDDDYGVSDERCKFKEEAWLSRSKRFMRFDDNYFFWSIPPELFTIFKEVYILTYLFYGQSLRCFMDLHNIPYEYIGAKKTEDGYVFCPADEMDRKRELRDKVHIVDLPKLNSIGARRTDLSYTWYSHLYGDNNQDKFERIRKNIINLFRNIYRCKSREFMWTTFKERRGDVRDFGFASGFVTYNMKASNDYIHKKYLAYCVNNFPKPWENRYYKEHGVQFDGDVYAVSILIQWLFRSAIRKGEEVWIYVPSARMRSLLIQWLDKLAEGKDLEPVHYKTPRKNNNKKDEE